MVRMATAGAYLSGPHRTASALRDGTRIDRDVRPTRAGGAGRTRTAGEGEPEQHEHDTPELEHGRLLPKQEVREDDRPHGLREEDQ